MRRNISCYLVIALLPIIAGISSCKPDEIKINYEFGTFPESGVIIPGINSEFDDYNSTIPQIIGTLPIMFSTNRSSSGGNFDITTGVIQFTFDQVSGIFTMEGKMYNNGFFDALEAIVNSPSDQLGPYRFFNSRNGNEFFFFSTISASGDLDIRFLEYLPPVASDTPYMGTPLDATRLNGASDDGYIAIDWDIMNVYLTSDRGGDFDIYTEAIDEPANLATWLTAIPQDMVKADSVNSTWDDKCPFIFDKYMIFTSDRPGGFGGFDLYYSTFANGKWGSPVNFGPDINSEFNEYRPVVGIASGYNNYFMIFSSDRPGGMGGYDLYLTGVTFE